jgi:hypothetical protein
MSGESDTLSLLFKIIAIAASSFLASYMTYLFAIKGKIKEIDIEKEKHLNIALSNLLLIWQDLNALKRLFFVIEDKSDDLIFSKKFLSVVILSKKLLSEDKFEELKTSIEELKKYDALTYFRFENIGDNLKEVKSRFILPFLEMDDIENIISGIGKGTGKLFDNYLKDYEEYIFSVAKSINKKIKNKISDLLQDLKNDDPVSVVNELNINYYQLMLSLLYDESDKPSYEEFLEIVKTEEYKNMIELHMVAFENNGIASILEIVSEKPDISIEEAIRKYNEKLAK